ncbi:MAG: helix-turn-helix domain-containing protein [Candidatus Ornithomonoglobus sp.]
MLDNYGDILNFDEFIEILKIGRNTGYRLLNSGEIQARRLGKQWRISKTAVLNWLTDVKAA